jgi:hypothetical protein
MKRHEKQNMEVKEWKMKNVSLQGKRCCVPLSPGTWGISYIVEVATYLFSY